MIRVNRFHVLIVRGIAPTLPKLGIVVKAGLFDATTRETGAWELALDGGKQQRELSSIWVVLNGSNALQLSRMFGDEFGEVQACVSLPEPGSPDAGVFWYITEYQLSEA